MVFPCDMKSYDKLLNGVYVSFADLLDADHIHHLVSKEFNLHILVCHSCYAGWSIYQLGLRQKMIWGGLFQIKLNMVTSNASYNIVWANWVQIDVKLIFEWPVNKKHYVCCVL